VNCGNPNDPDYQLICPKLSKPSAICKMCEAWQEADHFWRRWFKGGILTDFWRNWTEKRRLHTSDEQSSEDTVEGDKSNGDMSPFERAYLALTKEYVAHTRDYLTFTRRLFYASIATVAVGVLGTIGLGASIFIASDRAEMRQTRYITVATWTLELDKIHNDHPELLEYFRAGKTIEKDFKNSEYGRVIATAEFYMDLMDSMLDRYDDKWPDEGWGNWAEYTFSKSPMLRSHLEEQSSWYCKHLYPKYLEWAKKSGTPAPPQVTCK